MVDALTGNAIGVVGGVGGREKMKEIKQKCGMKKANILSGFWETKLQLQALDWTGHSSRVPAFLAVAPGLNFFSSGWVEHAVGCVSVYRQYGYLRYAFPLVLSTGTSQWKWVNKVSQDMVLFGYVTPTRAGRDRRGSVRINTGIEK